MLTRHSQDIKKWLALSISLLALLTLVPLASAQPANAPALQATATATPTLEATETVEPTAAATAAETAVGTPSTLPQTGGVGADPTSWVPVLIVGAGVVVVLIGMGLTASSRKHSS